MADSIAILAQLIAIPSVNPDQCSSELLCNEGRLAAALKALFVQLNPTEVILDEIAPHRPNIYGVWLAPGGSARWRCLDVHLDTVAVAHCVGDPFRAHVDANNRLHGRGACDTKASLALAISLLSEFQTAGIALPHNLIVAGTVGEETTALGAKRFASWFAVVGRGHQLTSFPPARLKTRGIVLDELVVAEPTLCQPIYGHKGTARIQFDFEGLAVHSSQPHLGHNALVAAANVVLALDDHHHALQQQPSPIGPPSVVTTLASGGIATNIVPPTASITLDRRVVVGEKAVEVAHALVDLGRAHAVVRDAQILFIPKVLYTSEAFFSAPDSVFIQRLSTWAGAGPATAPYGTNASDYDSSIARACVVMGPGSIDQAHQADEWIAVEELLKMRAILRAWWLSDD